MPRFALKTPMSDEHPFNALDDFARGYVEAAFYTAGDCDDVDLNASGAGALSPDAVAGIAAYCAAFQAAAGDLLAQACRREGYDAAQAGRDLWLTANGHAAGYWTRDALAADGLGERLTDIAQDMGARMLVMGDDGAIGFDEG